MPNIKEKTDKKVKNSLNSFRLFLIATFFCCNKKSKNFLLIVNINNETPEDRIGEFFLKEIVEFGAIDLK